MLALIFYIFMITEMPDCRRKVSPASLVLPLVFCVSPASTSVRYRWSRINPTMPSYAICRKKCLTRAYFLFPQGPLFVVRRSWSRIKTKWFRNIACDGKSLLWVMLRIFSKKLLKGQSHEILYFWFFRQTVPLGPLIQGLKRFRIKSRIRWVIRNKNRPA
jgi:hypothetical protein